MKTINYYSKDVYGKTLYYFCSSSDAVSWYNLTGHKTISKSEMQQMELLTAITFERAFDPVTV